MHIGFCWGNLKERDLLKDLAVNGWAVLKWILKEQDGMCERASAGSKQEFLNQVKKYQILQNFAARISNSRASPGKYLSNRNMNCVDVIMWIVWML